MWLAQFQLTMNKRANKIFSFCAHSEKVNCAKISADGQYYVTGGDDNKAALWRSTGELVLSAPGSSPVTAVAIDEESKMIAVGGESGGLKFVKISSQKTYRFTGHRAKVTCVEFHASGDHLVSASVDGTVKVWQLSTASTKKESVQTIKHNEAAVTAVLCTPDMRYIASGTVDGKIKITDITVAREKALLLGHTNAILCLRTHPEQELLASSSIDKTVRIWDLDRYEVVCITEMSSTPLRSVAFHPTVEAFIAGMC